jgi:hypothetical protein
MIPVSCGQKQTSLEVQVRSRVNIIVRNRMRCHRYLKWMGTGALESQYNSPKPDAMSQVYLKWMDPCRDNKKKRINK